MAVQSSPYEPSGPQSRPWIRWAARIFDINLFGFSIGILLGFLSPSALDKIPDRVFSVLLIALYVFVEPLMLCSWGTTPGKAILKIRLRRQHGLMLSYAQAFNRSASVWSKGLGCGIPLISLIFLSRSYNRLVEDGITQWDRDGNFSVSHQIIGPVRVLIIVILLVGFIGIPLTGLFENAPR